MCFPATVRVACTQDLIRKPHSRCAALIATLLLAVSMAPVRGEEFPDGSSQCQPSSVPGFFKRERLFDSCLRDSLASRGVTFDGDFIGDFLGNVSGGRRQKFRSAWRSTFGLDFDLDEILGIEGARLRISGAWNEGKNLGTDIETIYNPSEIYGLRGGRFWELYWGQELLDGQLDLIIGRQTVADRFNVVPVTYNYVNVAVFSISLMYNDFAFRGRPIGMWGISGRFDPDDSPLYLVSGVYSGAPRDLQRTSARGLDFDLQLGESTLAALEIGYKKDQSEGAAGLPGTYGMGVIYNSARFDSLSDPGDSKRGNFNFYVHADQVLFREAGSDTKGLDGYAMVHFPADDDINLVSFFFMGGLTYTGLFDSRGADKTYASVSHAELNDAIEPLSEQLFQGAAIVPNQANETVAEVGHVFQITPFWSINPTAQYIVNPGVTDDVDDAVVLGVETVLTF